MARFEIVEHEGQKMVRVTIQNETIRAESGALHYMRGQIDMQSQTPSAGGMMKSMFTGESVFKPTYTGTGEVYFGPPQFGEYLVLDLQDEHWILDPGAYVCSDAGIEVGAFRNKAMSSLMGGEGFFQTSVKGTGRVVMQAPGKVQRIDLQGERLAVDGSYAIARTGSVDFTVRRASRSVIGSMTSGEGLLNIFEGSGTVLIAPVPNLYKNLVTQSRAMPVQAQASRPSMPPVGRLIGCVVALGFVGLTLIMGIIGFLLQHRGGFP